MRAVAAALAVVAACQSPGERALEEQYSRAIIQILTTFEQDYASTMRGCQAGPLDCAVAARDGADAARRARARLAALTPPGKLRDANQRLIAGLDQLAVSYDIVGDTYWDQSDLLGSYARSVRSVEKAVQEIGAASVLIGFKGDRGIWSAKRLPAGQ